MSPLRSRHWLWLLLLIPIGTGLVRLRFDAEVLNLLPDDSSVVQGLKLYQQNFSSARELIITLQSNDADRTENAARTLTAALRGHPDLVAEANWQPPWLEHPAQAAELIGFLWLNQAPLVVNQLAERLRGASLTNTLVETREALATSFSPSDIAFRANDPFGLTELPEGLRSGTTTLMSAPQMFASDDGTFRAVFVEAKTDLAGYRECLAWLDRVRAIEQEWRAQNDIGTDLAIGYTGRPAFVAEIARGMERDMTLSVAGTMLIVALLFWWAHRQFRPLLWLLTLLVVTLAATLSVGGLILGPLNVISIGFAAILLGIAVDYGLVLYQEAQVDPEPTPERLRRLMAPGILWSAITTAGAFALLNLSGLPGLAQLGSLVAIGVVFAASVILGAYLPPLLGSGPSAGMKTPGASRTSSLAKEGAHPLDPAAAPRHHGTSGQQTQSPTRSLTGAWVVTGVILLVALLVLFRERPGFDRTADSLRPKQSAAYAAIEEIKRNLGRTQEPLWLLVPGRTEAEVADRLEALQPILDSAVSNQVIRDFTLAAALWPHPQNQKDNRATIAQLLQRADPLSAAALAQGFTSNSLALTEGIFRAWQQAVAQTHLFWPTNQASLWTLSKVASRTDAGCLALGLVYPLTNSPPAAGWGRASLSTLNAQLAGAGSLLSGWELLGPSLFDRVLAGLPRVLFPMLLLLTICLWLAFRQLSALVLSLATLLFAGLGLCLIMSLADWSWNLLNLMALPLLLGSGIDYSIHMQLALRRHGGHISSVRRGIGRALLLCGGTTTAAFGSLAWSSNAGMASLGRTCAAGLLCVMLTAVYLLPAWWKVATPDKIRIS